MITDAFTLLSGSLSAAGAYTAQAVTATAVGTNTLDGSTLSLGSNQARDLGLGENFFVTFSTTVAATAAGAATVTFEIIQADDAALTTNVEAIAATGPIGKASLTVGTQINLRWPPNSALPSRRYFGVRYTVATGPLTAGSFIAQIVKDIQGEQVYGRSGYTVA